MSRIEAHQKGDKIAADNAIRPRLLPKEYYQSAIQALLNHRDDVVTDPAELTYQAINHLYDLACAAATFGVGVEKLSPVAETGFHPVVLPHVPSRILIESGIAVKIDTREQIAAREARQGRTERAENWLEMKILSKEEIGILLKANEQSMSGDEKWKLTEARVPEMPVILIKEHYTATLFHNPILDFDIDVTGSFLIFKFQPRAEILFWEETHAPPHAHITHEKTGDIRVEMEDFTPELLESFSTVTVPQPMLRRSDGLATNEQIATLLVLFKESIKG